MRPDLLLSSEIVNGIEIIVTLFTYSGVCICRNPGRVKQLRYFLFCYLRSVVQINLFQLRASVIKWSFNLNRAFSAGLENG